MISPSFPIASISGFPQEPLSLQNYLSSLFDEGQAYMVASDAATASDLKRVFRGMALRRTGLLRQLAFISRRYGLDWNGEISAAGGEVESEMRVIKSRRSAADEPLIRRASELEEDALDQLNKVLGDSSLPIEFRDILDQYRDQLRLNLNQLHQHSLTLQLAA